MITHLKALAMTPAALCECKFAGTNCLFSKLCICWENLDISSSDNCNWRQQTAGFERKNMMVILTKRISPDRSTPLRWQTIVSEPDKHTDRNTLAESLAQTASVNSCVVAAATTGNDFGLLCGFPTSALCPFYYVYLSAALCLQVGTFTTKEMLRKLPQNIDTKNTVSYSTSRVVQSM